MFTKVMVNDQKEVRDIILMMKVCGSHVDLHVFDCQIRVAVMLTVQCTYTNTGFYACYLLWSANEPSYV